MDFKITQNGSIVEIRGVIKTIDNVESVISVLNSINEERIVIKIYESFSLPSSIIGTLVKLKDDNKDIVLQVGSNVLYELLDNLNLISTFKVSKL